MGGRDETNVDDNIIRLYRLRTSEVEIKDLIQSTNGGSIPCGREQTAIKRRVKVKQNNYQKIFQK